MTVLVPPFAPGEKTRNSPAAQLRDYVHEAETRLNQLGATKEQIETLIAPLVKLASTPALSEGSHWSRAILRSPAVFEEFLLRRPVDAGMWVGQNFELLPLAAEIELSRELYVLKLSKKQATLVRVGALLEPVALPDAAETVEQFLALEQPDHDLENRNAVGGASGAARRVRFSTGNERETETTYLGDYYKHVDHAVTSFLRPRNAAVVLVGVDQDSALFRSVTGYPDVLEESIRRSPDDGGSDDDLIERALALLRASVLRGNSAALAAAKERLAPLRFSDHPGTIAHLAGSGRVGQLFIAEDARDENLNRALIETLKHAGEIHALPAGSAPAATLRY